MKILGVVPARGGSKRVPRKNVRPLHGLPLIAWTLRTVLQSRLCVDVVVSTDDGEIAEAARGAGASVPELRPAHLATDTATSVDVALHVLDVYEAHHGPVDGLMLLQPTSPFRSPASLRRAVDLFAADGGRAPVVGVSPAASHPAWCFSIEGARLRPFLGWEGLRRRSQDLAPAYALNGSIYLIAPALLRSAGAFLTEDARPLVMDDPAEAIDIDTPFDWNVAEAIARDRADGAPAGSP